MPSRDDGNSGTSWRDLLNLAVVLLGLGGQTIWFGTRVGAIETQIAVDGKRLDNLEQIGPPSVQAMRISQADDARRIDGLTTALAIITSDLALARERVSVLESELHHVNDSLADIPRKVPPSVRRSP